ncbi:MAG: hypothetical protein ACFFED_03600 [Candidatus Thorarchaeota archaeon]
MPKAWATIAKAEFRVATSRFRNRRLQVMLSLILIGLVWAFFVAPAIMQGFLDLFSEQVQLVLQAAYPGLMRSVILILWMMVLIYPITYSLQEVKIGQWEIMLSNNVSTRDMLFGMFMAKIPQYGILVIFMAPLLVSPFIIFYEVSILGQVFTYLIIGIFVIATLLLSTVISTAIQARLGTSARGNDIAKGMGLIIVLVFLVPLYGLIYFAESFAELLGLNVFLILPSTWAADLITWITIYNNGVNLPSAVIAVFEEILGLGIEIDLALVGLFALIVLVLGFITPDRIFSLEAGARTETITTVGKENLFLRILRRVVPGPQGVIIVLMMKDFGRKAQNTSKVVYATLLSIIVPLMISYSGLGSFQDSVYLVVFMTFFISMFLGLIGGVTFGGIGFLESKDHLWVIKSVPRGTSKFLMARIIDSFLFAIPMTLIPVLILSVVFLLAPLNAIIMLVHAYLVLCCTIFVSIGITCMNPAYEDTKSSAFHINTIATIVVSMIGILVGFLYEFNSEIFLDNVILGSIAAILPILFIGSTFLFIGKTRLSTMEA